MQPVVIATNNRHKLDEIKPLLAGNVQLLTLAEIGCLEELAEDRDTLEGNSLQKAQYVARQYKVTCFADDTGLEVEALGGKPGVHSARYAGPQRNSENNIDLLLQNLRSATNRRARFRTVITLIENYKVYQFDGIVNGTILEVRRGTGGFGYDAVFMPDGSAKTLAEMSMEEKNKISHRALAVTKLVNFLNSQS